MANIAETTKQISELGSRFSLSQKLSLGIAALLVFSLIGYAVMSVNTPDWRPLFSGLSADDAGRIATKLKDQKVPYKVSDDSGTIYAPSDKVNDLRIQLASEGLPESSRVGFELFDQTNFGATEFSEQVKFQRALEGELERTIASLSEVERVRVHIAMPRESFFRDREEKAKASVTLKLKSNQRLSEQSIAGVVHLVASSVQGLSPDQVSIVDTQGRMLARSGEQDGELKLTATQIELRESMEKQLSNRLVALLEPVVGAGKVRVGVAAEMNFARNEKLEEKYDPQSNAIRSAQTLEERESKDARNLSGNPAAGTKANQPQAPQPPDPKAPQSTSDPLAMPGHVKTSQTTNYEVTRTTTRTVDPAGDIRRLSVSVIVDNSAKLEGEGDGAHAVSVKRSAEEMEKIRQAVLGAIGIDEKRGDQLVVQNIAFDAGLEEPPAPPPTLIRRVVQDPDTIRTALRYVVPILLVLLAYFLIARPVLKWLTKKPAHDARARSAARLPETQLQALPPATEKGLKSAEAPRTVQELESELHLDSIESAPVTKADIIKVRLREKSQKEPELMAQMVRAWLHEDAAAGNGANNG